MYMAMGPVCYQVVRPPCEELRVFGIRLDTGPIVHMVVRGPKKTANISGMISCLQDPVNAAVEARQNLAANWVQLCVSKQRKVIVIADRIPLLKDLAQRLPELHVAYLIGATKQKDRGTAKDAQVICASYGVASEVSYLWHLLLHVL